MIEVEKKFQPTPEQLAKMLDGAQLVEVVTIHDEYYDYPDYRLLKKHIRLRNRNGNFELKIGNPGGAGFAEEIAEEVESAGAIQKYFGTDKPLSLFVSEDLITVISYIQHRKQYRKEGFTIDVDEIDFGYSCVEIELMVEKPEEVAHAHEKIIEFAKSFGCEVRSVPPKKAEYLRLKNPDLYKEIYG